MPESTRVVSAFALLLCAAVVSWAEAPQPTQDPFPQDAHRDLVVRTCAACHPPELVVSRQLSAQEWEDVIARMIERGAVATDEEQQQIIDYFVRHYGGVD
jgi:hypothetical protein